jgi:hypothetical protein
MQGDVGHLGQQIGHKNEAALKKTKKDLHDKLHSKLLEEILESVQSPHGTPCEATETVEEFKVQLVCLGQQLQKRDNEEAKR